MRRKGRTNPNGRTLTRADARIDLRGEKLNAVSILPELFAQAEELSSHGKWREAAHTCRRGLAIQPDNLTGLLLLGTALWETGEVQEAVRTLTLARNQLEKHARLYSILAEISRHNGDAEGAEKMVGLYKALLQTDVHQATPLTSENASTASRDAVPPVGPVLERLNLLAHALESRSTISSSPNSFFTDSDRCILKRIIQRSHGCATR